MFKIGDKVRYIGGIRQELAGITMTVIGFEGAGRVMVSLPNGGTDSLYYARLGEVPTAAKPVLPSAQPTTVSAVENAERALALAEQQAQEAVQKAQEALKMAHEYQASQDAEKAAVEALQARIDGVLEDTSLARGTAALLDAIHEALVNDNYTANKVVAKHREVLAPLAAKHGFEIVVVGDGSGVMLKDVSYAE